MDAVQRRAYHLFEGRGTGHGRDLDDWLEAQSQTLCLPQVQTSEDATHYVVLASLAGFTADLIWVIVSPHDMVLRAELGVSRLNKQGELALKALTYCRFPQPVDTPGVQAFLTNGVLRVALPKITPETAL
jgi:HSP20 family molecular chaperone IbpA